MAEVDRRAGWTGSALRTWARHPRLGLAARTALAAALAWGAAQVVPGPAAEYPYYAPMGAVIATSATLVASVRESLQGVLAITLGAVIALGVDALAYPNVVTVAVVVGLGVLVAGWAWLGDMGTFVTTAALFVLIIGNADPVGFASSYAGLALLGAAIGVGVNLAFPPMPLAPAQLVLGLLRDVLAEQLDSLAEGLGHDDALDDEGWRQRRKAVEPVFAQARSAVERAEQSRTGNRRARRYQAAAQRQYEQARALERLSFLIEDLTQLVAEGERQGNEHLGLGSGLRPSAAQALSRLADVLRSVDGTTADRRAIDAADDALRSLVGEIGSVRSTTGDGLFVASSIVLSLRRSLETVEVAAASSNEGARRATAR